MARDIGGRLLAFAMVGVTAALISGVDNTNGPLVIAILAGVTLALYWNAKRTNRGRR